MSDQKSTSERMFEYLGSTERDDATLADIANEVEYAEAVNSNALRLLFDIAQSVDSLIHRANDEMKKAFSPERYAAFDAEAKDRVAQEAQEGQSVDLEEFLQRLMNTEGAPVPVPDAVEDDEDRDGE